MTAKPTKPAFVIANVLAVVSCCLSVWACVLIVIGLLDFADYLYRPDPPLLAVEHFPGVACGLLAVIVAYMAVKLLREVERSKPGWTPANLAKISLLLGGGAFVANGVLVFKILIGIFYSLCSAC